MNGNLYVPPSDRSRRLCCTFRPVWCNRRCPRRRAGRPLKFITPINLHTFSLNRILSFQEIINYWELKLRVTYHVQTQYLQLVFSSVSWIFCVDAYCPWRRYNDWFNNQIKLSGELKNVIDNILSTMTLFNAQLD